MSNEELVMKIATMLSEGKGEDIEKALKIVAQNTQETHDTQEIQNVAEDDNNNNGEVEDDGTGYLKATFDSVKAMYGPMGANIVVLPIPTPYGLVLLADFRSFPNDVSIDDVRAALEDSVDGLDASVIKIGKIYDEARESMIDTICLIPRDNEDDEDMKLCIIYPERDILYTDGITYDCPNSYGLDYEYILPVTGSFAGLGCAAINLQDMANAVSSMMMYLETNNLDTIVFPELGYKITKGDGTCRGGKEYTTGTKYFVDGELIPHKNGIHYTSNPERLKTWYKNDYRSNHVLLVQPSLQTVADGDILATDSLIVLGEIDWDEID